VGSRIRFNPAMNRLQHLANQSPIPRPPNRPGVVQNHHPVRRLPSRSHSPLVSRHHLSSPHSKNLSAASNRLAASNSTLANSPLGMPKPVSNHSVNHSSRALASHSSTMVNPSSGPRHATLRRST